MGNTHIIPLIFVVVIKSGRGDKTNQGVIPNKSEKTIQADFRFAEWSSRYVIFSSWNLYQSVALRNVKIILRLLYIHLFIVDDVESRRCNALQRATVEVIDVSLC